MSSSVAHASCAACVADRQQVRSTQVCTGGEKMSEEMSLMLTSVTNSAVCLERMCSVYKAVKAN